MLKEFDRKSVGNREKQGIIIRSPYKERGSALDFKNDAAPIFGLINWLSSVAVE